MEELTNLTLLSPSQLISPRHLQRQSRTDLDLCSQKLRAIPVMMHLLLNLLPDRQLLLLLLLLRNLLLILRHGNLVIVVSGILRVRIILYDIRQLRLRFFYLLAVFRLRFAFFPNWFLRLFRIEFRGREGLRRGRCRCRRIGGIPALQRNQESQCLYLGWESPAVESEVCGGCGAQCTCKARASCS